jgi:shikimate kinase
MREIQTDASNPNLYLLGFMGTGKSVLGKRVASRLGYRYIDSDHEIEKKCGMPTKEIFAQFGEEKFRQMEREFIESGHPNSNCVISCGGGLCCRDDMPELVKSKGISIVLFSTPEEILERTSRNKSRPLLNVENPLERIKTLLNERTPFYMRSGVAIAADKNLKITEEHIIRIYMGKKRSCKKIR